jgi:hypothetical protein
MAEGHRQMHDGADKEEDVFFKESGENRIEVIP